MNTRTLGAWSLLVLAACARPVPPAAPAPAPPPAVPAPSPEAPAPPPPPAPAPRAPRFVLHAADVGTGLALFVEGEDFALVYDAGSNDDKALGEDNRFVRYLHTVRPDLRTIDHVILSHPHADHVELLADVVAGYRVRDVWDSGALNDACGYRRFLGAVADAPETVYHSATKGMGSHRIDFGKVVCGLPRTVTISHGATLEEDRPIRLGAHASMRFLHVDAKVHGEDFNRNSLVTLLDLDGTRVLLMGDAEAGGRAAPTKAPTAGSVEGYVLRNHRAELRADVLVAGHHGSLSSTRAELLAAVAPKISIVSSGPHKYQSVTLPAPEIVAELTRVSELHRTDVDDAACATNPAKIGPDADGEPGGCDNVQVVIQGGRVEARDAHLHD